MRRFLTGIATGLVAICTTAGVAGEGPPPLTPPVLGPLGPVDEPPIELPPPVEATPMPGLEPSPIPVEVRPMLVIPGVNTPRAGQRFRPSTPPTDPPAVGPTPGRATLGPPVDVPTIDIFPPDELKLDSPERPAAPTARARVAPPERRQLGLVERLFPGLGNATRRGVPPASSARFEPPTDPAADAALKRSVERQIEARLGDRVRRVEVRVVGGQVVVRAAATRFWQKRGVRIDLESLPALSGKKATVQLDP